MKVLCLLATLILVSGCVSSGKPVTTGPLSWLTGELISSNRGYRRAEVLRSVQLGSGDAAVPAVGVDLLALDKASSLTWKEWATHIVAVATELYAYYEAVDEVRDKLREKDSEEKPAGTVTEEEDRIIINSGVGTVVVICPRENR
jgi:hypothetical protein